MVLFIIPFVVDAVGMILSSGQALAHLRRIPPLEWWRRCFWTDREYSDRSDKGLRWL